MRRVNDDLIEISDTVRIERGRPRRSAIATEELLSNEVTASHYAVGERDAAGEVIELGKEMEYIDWLSEELVWYIYRHDGERFQRIGWRSGEAEAVAFALEG